MDGALAYIVTDHLGTPKELLAEDGSVVWSAKHELWGKVRAVQHLRAANDNAGYQDCLLRFQGQIEDEETGLYYNRFRYYDPASGNYCSSDPIGLRGGSRPNQYVLNTTTWTDPFGLEGTLTIYSHSPPGDLIGHSFIAINDGVKTRHIGQWPASGFDSKKGLPNLFTKGVPGALGSTPNKFYDLATVYDFVLLNHHLGAEHGAFRYERS